MNVNTNFIKDQMHYNHFTIEYIKAVERNLKIQFDATGNATCVIENIKQKDILSLKNDLQSIWEDADSSISIVKSKQGATIQSGLFGLVNELDIALKVGFLLGDRVVLIDYLYERLLKRKDPDKINLIHLGVIASSLVNALSLAETGRLVIIPNPFGWNPESKKIIEEVATKTIIDTNLMSLLNMLSITKTCQLHPFTIAESETLYSSILDNQVNNLDVIGRDGGKYAYEGILGALLSEKLLKETEFSVALDIPLSKYFEIISSEQDFYLKYLADITAGGSLSAKNNIDDLRNAVMKSIKEKNKNYLKSAAKTMTTVGGLGSAMLGALTATSVISAPIAVPIAAIMALSAGLTGLVNSKQKNEQPIISVFSKLYKA